MKLIAVTMVRVYITESSNLLKPILEYLTKDAKIRGVTVFRAIGGYGDSGAHLASLVDLSLDLPLTVEFFDLPEIIENTLNHLNTMIKPEHIVCWQAQTNSTE